MPASPSASVGLVRALARAATSPARTADRTPAPTAASIGSGPIDRVTPFSTMPRSIIRSNHHRASSVPGSSPARPAIRATNPASVEIIRRICQGVAPTARSSAKSRRRWATDSVVAPATTNTETMATTPPKDPPTATSISLVSPRPGCSTSPRPSPVRTLTSVSFSALRRSPATLPVEAPSASSTPNAVTLPGFPASRGASESAT